MVAQVMAKGGLRKPALVAAAAAILVALLGGLATDVGPWYRGLAKPSFQPPDWAFGPAWSVIYTLTAVAGVLAWRAAESEAERLRILALYGVCGLLNVLWSVLFFTFRRPDWAFAEGVLLWLSVLWITFASARLDRRTGWLLVPHILWVTFAIALNWAVVDLNQPFGG